MNGMYSMNGTNVMITGIMRKINSPYRAKTIILIISVNYYSSTQDSFIVPARYKVPPGRDSK